MKKKFSILTLILLLALSHCMPAMASMEYDVIYDETNELGSDTPSQAVKTMAESVGMGYIFDVSDLLTYEEWEKLESRARDISKRQHCGIYFALVDDYTDYGEGGVYEVTYQLYHGSQLGFGANRDGIIVLLSMEERDYAMFVYGEYAEYAFDDFGQEKLEERFHDDFGDNDWYGGISDYLDACDVFLTNADEGKPIRSSHWPLVIVAVGISCLIAGGICFLLLRSMMSVHQKKEADVYLTGGGLHLTQQYDQYTHSTETRRKIEKSSSRNSESGGGSGRSGKF